MSSVVSSFNMEVIPPTMRSQKQVDEHMEIWKRSLDTIRVHNPTDEDFIVWDNKKVAGQSWVIPAQTKDIGKGKGNQDMPRFAANRYISQMVPQLIAQIAQKAWEKEREQYRHDEWGEKEEHFGQRYANDEKLMQDVTQQLFLGVVEKFGTDQSYGEVEPPRSDRLNLSFAERILGQMNIEDKEIEESKQEFTEQIS